MHNSLADDYEWNEINYLPLTDGPLIIPSRYMNPKKQHHQYCNEAIVIENKPKFRAPPTPIALSTGSTQTLDDDDEIIEPSTTIHLSRNERAAKGVIKHRVVIARPLENRFPGEEQVKQVARNRLTKREVCKGTQHTVFRALDEDDPSAPTRTNRAWW